MRYTMRLDCLADRKSRSLDVNWAQNSDQMLEIFNCALSFFNYIDSSYILKGTGVIVSLFVPSLASLRSLNAST